MAKTSYDPYTAINNIFNYKGDWATANSSGDEIKKNAAAAGAQPFYNELKANGYGDVADQLAAADYTAAKTIRDKWAKTSKEELRPYLYNSKLTTEYGLSNADIDNLLKFDSTTGQVIFGGKNMGTPYSLVDGASYWNASDIDNAIDNYISLSGITPSNEKLESKASAGVSNKVNQLWGIQTDDHKNLTNLYNQEYDYLKNTNPFETEIGKAILGKYDLSALQARDNAVASSGASNSGNLDSYAAANALRQQASLISQGQDAVLSAHQQRLNNARSLLESLGVSQQNNYTSMQNTIGIEQSEAQRLFENSETAKNNDVARKAEIAAVSGYTPDEWVVSNNPYLNDDGTIKDEYKNVDFSAVMADAKAKGNTEVYNAAATARFHKIMGDYATYGQYDDGNYALPGSQRTAEYDLTQQQIASAEKIAKGENDTNLAIADKEASVTQQQINASLEAARLENEKDAYAGYNVLLSMWPTNEVEKRAFIEKHIKPLYESGTAIPPESLKQLIVANSTAYNIDVDDATKICQAYGVSTDWLSGYRDRTASDGNVTWYDGSIHEGQYGGMVKK